MISTYSLADNVVPNVYIKNVTLDSTYNNPVVMTDAAYPGPKATGKKGKSKKWTTQELLKMRKQKKTTGHSQSSLLLSLKFVKNNSLQSNMELLTNSDLSKYIKVFVHQITDKQKYEELLHTGDPLKRAIKLTTEHDMQTIKTKTYFVSDFQQSLGELILSDGATIKEITKQTTFGFDRKEQFLSYVIVTAVIPGEQNKGSSEDVFLSKVTAEIILHDGALQNEALLFRIAPDNDSTLFATFGKPGTIWTGGVHRNPETGRFMTGDEHTSEPHPFLDYEIVPALKFVDNRVKDKIERNIINVSSAFSRMNSLTARYKNSGTNLIDFESYKKLSYASDLFLSQDSAMNIQGAFIIDKLNLIKSKCAFPFLFANMEGISNNNESKLKTHVDKILSLASLEKLSVYENKKLLSITTQWWLDNYPNFPISQTKGFPHITGKPAITFTSLDNFKTGTGLQSFSFKRWNETSSMGNFQFSIDFNYKDPTIEYVKEILPTLSQAILQVNSVLEKVYLEKAFDKITSQINKDFVKNLLDTEDVDKFGYVRAVTALMAMENFAVFFWNPDVNLSQIQSFFMNTTNVKTAQSEGLLLIQKFLIDLKIQIESLLSSVGSKPRKSSKGGVKRSSIVSKPSFSNRIIKGNIEGSATVLDYGYDFTGVMKRDESALTTIQSDTYLKLVDTRILPQLTNYEMGQFVPPTVINSSFRAKETSGKETIGSTAYAYLNIPPQYTANSVKLPPTVTSKTTNTVNIENIFTSIIKYNAMILENNSSKTADGLIKKDLKSILANSLDTDVYMNLVKALEKSVKKDTLTNEEKFGGSTDADETPFGFPGSYNAPSDSEESTNPPEDNLKDATDKNFFSFALLNKFLLGKNDSFTPDMSTKTFRIDKKTADAAPLQVKALSIKGQDRGALNDFANENFIYINKNVINPLLLCYYWFIHQNIVHIEYLSGWKEVTYSTPLKNKENPYVAGKPQAVKTRSTKNPIWLSMSAGTLNALNTNEKLLCRMTQYETNYIDKTLLEKLKLPLLNNYFIIEGA